MDVRLQSGAFGGMAGGTDPESPRICENRFPQMPLKDLEIRALKPREKPYKKADSGGLYVEVVPSGSKLWRWKFRANGVEKRLALGAYPAVSLADARKLRDAERVKLSEGVDPALARKRDKILARLSAENTFESIAREYIDTKMVPEGRADATVSKARWFLEKLAPAIGSMPITEVDPQLLLAALKKLEAKGRLETAKKCRSFASRVFRYAVVTGRCKSDPAYRCAFRCQGPAEVARISLGCYHALLVEKHW